MRHVSYEINLAGDAYARASMLQRIEDAWDADKLGGLQLLLIPAKHSESSKADLYEKVGELYEKQRILLDQIDRETGPVVVQRLKLIRQASAETLATTSKLYPSLRHGVS